MIDQFNFRNALEVTVGSSPGVGIILVYLWRLNRTLNSFLIEHEMLMLDYAERKGVHLEHIPTRTRMH